MDERDRPADPVAHGAPRARYGARRARVGRGAPARGTRRALLLLGDEGEGLGEDNDNALSEAEAVAAAALAPLVADSPPVNCTAFEDRNATTGEFIGWLLPPGCNEYETSSEELEARAEEWADEITDAVQYYGFRELSPTVARIVPARSAYSSGFVRSVVRRPTRDVCDLHGLSQSEACYRVSKGGPCRAADSSGYMHFTYCNSLGGQAFGIAALMLWAAVLFYTLAIAADKFFCPALETLTNVWQIPPDIAGVTLLSFGNGAPDIFAEIAAITHGGKPDAALATASAMGSGIFISTVVLGAVAFASPVLVEIERHAFWRDVIAYLVAVLLVMGIVLDRVIGFYQALLLGLYYVCYIGYVVYAGRKKSGDATTEPAFDLASQKGGADDIKGSVAPTKRKTQYAKGDGNVFQEAVNWVKWQVDWDGMTPVDRYISPVTVPVTVAMSVTMPELTEGSVSKTYATVIAVCGTVFFLLSGGSLPLMGQILPFNPLLYVLACAALSAGTVMVVVPADKGISTGDWFVSSVTFVQSIMWMHFAADSLVATIEAIGRTVGLSEAFLGATVLAWGNCVGDFVACISVARAGQPAMAVAACFAGPLFNMLAGLSTALLFENMMVGTVTVIPSNALLLLLCFTVFALIGVLFIVPYCGFSVPKNVGVGFAGAYAAFAVVYALTEIGVLFPTPWFSA